MWQKHQICLKFYHLLIYIQLLRLGMWNAKSSEESELGESLEFFWNTSTIWIRKGHVHLWTSIPFMANEATGECLSIANNCCWNKREKTNSLLSIIKWIIMNMLGFILLDYIFHLSFPKCINNQFTWVSSWAEANADIFSQLLT